MCWTSAAISPQHRLGYWWDVYNIVPFRIFTSFLKPYLVLVSRKCWWCSRWWIPSAICTTVWGFICCHPETSVCIHMLVHLIHSCIDPWGLQKTKMIIILLLCGRKQFFRRYGLVKVKINPPSNKFRATTYIIHIGCVSGSLFWVRNDNPCFLWTCR